ncbi:MerR family transcriptional regulator [Rugamonas sp.]|uniref:MerR family transcriptional regulator n=1 Tax=Rugamonas sp. TaxID=1926287 RepID=UPI0025F60F57|nr:MerR family transcriptional regulator [Rugamonas sp.]
MTSTSDKAAATLTVRAAAERLGVTPRTLKYYEERGLVWPSRSVGRYRLYDENDLDRFARILHLRSMGFTVEAITEILKRPLETPKGGRKHLSRQSLNEIEHALQAQVAALDKRIAGVRRELNEAQTVRAELVHDLAYVAGRLAGEPIDELLEQRRSLVKPARAARKTNA